MQIKYRNEVAGSTLCRWCDEEDEAAELVLLECEVLASRKGSCRGHRWVHVGG